MKPSLKDLSIRLEQSILDSKEDYLERDWEAWEDTYSIRISIEISREEDEV